MELFSELLTEGPALCREALFQAHRAIAILAGPVFGSVQVAAAASRMRVLNFQQLEILFPVWTLFREGCRAVTDLNPLDAAVGEFASPFHIAAILVSCNRSLSKRAVIDRAIERFCFTGLHFCGNEISHPAIVLLYGLASSTL